MSDHSCFVSFGEIMLRLSPFNRSELRNASTFDACYGGSEANVLYCLSSLKNQTRYLTALPNTSLGDAAVKHLQSVGIDTNFVVRTGDNMGMYFLEEGFGPRSAQVIFNRKSSEVTKLMPGDFDYDVIFDGCSCFHISGISFSLSGSVRALCFELLREAKKRGILISFDFNYRSKLWSVQEAAKIYREIVPFVDVLFCSERDLVAFLGTNTTDFYNTYSTTLLIVREREILDSTCQTTCASMYRKANGVVECVATKTVAFDVLERVGSGDAFVGGILHGLQHNFASMNDVLEFGLACFVLKHTLRGDVFSLSPETVRAFIETRSKDIVR